MASKVLKISRIVEKETTKTTSKAVYSEDGSILIRSEYRSKELDPFDLIHLRWIKRNYCGGRTFIVPYGVTKICDEAFANCTNIKKIVIPNSVTHIGKRAFYQCFALSDVVIPDSVVEIGDYAFFYCVQLKSITLSKSLKIISKCTFCNCHSLEIISIPESVETIEDNAFNHCDNLSEVYFHENLQIIGDTAFGSCNFKSITLPKTVTEIGMEAFSFCHKLRKIHFANRIQYVGYNAFSYTPWFSNQPEGPVYAGNVLLRYKGNKQEINLPCNTRWITDGAFIECRGLQKIIVDKHNRYLKSVDGVLYSKKVDELLCVPRGRKNSYELPTTVNLVHDVAFANCLLTDLIIKTEMQISESAFIDPYYGGNHIYIKRIIVPDALYDGYYSKLDEPVKTLLCKAETLPEENW
jgi:hypothetical protein